MTSATSHDVIFGRYFQNISIEDLVLNDSGSLVKLFQGNGNEDVLILRLSGVHTPPDDYTSDGSVTKAEWLFDETSGSTAANSAIDRSGTDGTLSGSFDWKTGCINNALHLAGADDYAAIETLSFNGSDYNQLTVCAWIKTVSSTVQPILDFDDSEYWSLALSNGTPRWSVASTSGTEFLNGTRALNDGKWHHLTAVFDHGKMTLYIDGNLDATADAAANTFGTGTVRYGFIGSGSEATTAGGTRGPENCFYGDLDEARIFLRALTAEQIQRMYDHGTDPNKNGLPDWWEQLHFAGTTDPAADPDDDQLNNLDEYIVGSDPADTSESFHLKNVSTGFSWDSSPGRTYSIYQSTNLLTGFEPVSSNIPWTDNSFSPTSLSTNASAFFRIGVQLDGTEGYPDLNTVQIETFNESISLQSGWDEWQNTNSGADPKLVNGSYVFDHLSTNWSQAAIQSVSTVDVTDYGSVDFKFHIKDFGGSSNGKTANGRTSFIVAEHDNDLNALYGSSGVEGLLFSINHNAINYDSYPDAASDPRTWVKIFTMDNTELGRFVVQSTNDFTLVLTMTDSSWSADVEGASYWVDGGSMSGLHGFDMSTWTHGTSLRMESWNFIGDFGPASIDGITIEIRP